MSREGKDKGFALSIARPSRGKSSVSLMQPALSTAKATYDVSDVKSEIKMFA